MLAFAPSGLGWRQCLPDARDYKPDSPEIMELLAPLKRARAARSRRRAAVDLREFFPPVRDQQRINSSPVHACTGVIEYFERRTHGKTVHPSRLFLYQMTRRLMGGSGDTGADFRSVLKALISFGVPPEKHWPYSIETLDKEPPDFLFSFAHK